MSAPLRRAAGIISRPTTAFGVRVPRRNASAAYANLKVKKQNWVEQNEVARENQFFSWAPGSHNMAALLFMTVVFPVGFHHLFKAEQELRDHTLGGFKEGEKRARL